jgi:hypothetical protein
MMLDDLTRRAALQKATSASLLAALVPAAPAQAADGPADPVPKSERDRVIAIGMTEGEADCWMAAAEVAGKFFALAEMHPMDKQEVATAIHVIQNKLLSRPSYRRYLEEAKKQAEKK